MVPVGSWGSVPPSTWSIVWPTVSTMPPVGSPVVLVTVSTTPPAVPGDGVDDAAERVGQWPGDLIGRVGDRLDRVGDGGKWKAELGARPRPGSQGRRPRQRARGHCASA